MKILSTLFLAVVVLMACSSVEARGDSCVPGESSGEAANLLWQAASTDPAFQALASQLIRWGYEAKSTCIIGKTTDNNGLRVIYEISQQLAAKRGRRATSKELPPYQLLTRVAVTDQGASAPASSVSLLEFIVRKAP